MIDLVDLDAGVLDRLLERALGPVEQVLGHLLELRAGDLDLEVQRTLSAGRDVRQVHCGLGLLRKLDLRLLGGLAQPLQRHLVLGEVDPVAVLEGGHQEVDEALVPVVATKVGVAAGRLDLDDALADLKERYVERAASEVEDQDRLFLLALVQAVRQRRGGRLVDDAQHVEAGDRAGLLGCLALRVVEVGRDGDHGVGDLLAQVGLGVALQLLQDPGADLLRRVLLAVDLDVPVGADMALDGSDRPVRIGDGLPLGDLTDENLSVLGKRDDGRRGARSLGVRDDRGLAAFEDGDDGVRGAQVDADRSCHGCLLQT